jgi:transcriptional regulator GlxA family with amidase domain
MISLFLFTKRGEKGRKDQDNGVRVRNDGAMLRTLANIGEGDVAERLRRGLSPADGPRAVDAMARNACYSRRQFHRLTVQAIGETPGAHQRRLRLDRAAWLLLTSRTTILEIALETGWESHETFLRAFRGRFGITPSSFRKTRGTALPRSIRLALCVAAHAATHSISSGRAARRGQG